MKYSDFIKGTATEEQFNDFSNQYTDIRIVKM